MPRKKRDIESALENKGFQRHEGDHSRFIFWTQDGKKTRAKTKTSHGRSGASIGDPLLVTMSRQCFLSKQDFLNLVDCTLDRDGYEGKLREKDLI